MFGGAKPLFISFLYHIMYIHTHSFKTFVEFRSSDFLALAVATVQDGIEMWESVLWEKFPALGPGSSWTYGPLIDTALHVMLLRRANALLGQVGGGWALEISTFLGPKWHSPKGSMLFHRAQIAMLMSCSWVKWGVNSYYDVMLLS